MDCQVLEGHVFGAGSRGYEIEDLLTPRATFVRDLTDFEDDRARSITGDDLGDLVP